MRRKDCMDRNDTKKMLKEVLAESLHLMRGGSIDMCCEKMAEILYDRGFGYVNDLQDELIDVQNAYDLSNDLTNKVQSDYSKTIKRLKRQIDNLRSENKRLSELYKILSDSYKIIVNDKNKEIENLRKSQSTNIE